MVKFRNKVFRETARTPQSQYYNCVIQSHKVSSWDYHPDAVGSSLINLEIFSILL